MSEILPVLTIYALAGFKLLPAFQNIYANLSHVRGNIASFEEISSDLEGSFKINPNTKSDLTNGQKIAFNKSIEFNDICFTYPGKAEQILNKLNLSIPNNKVIGIVGSSGSGKSTFINLLLSLIEADKGKVLLDGEEIGKFNGK